MHVNNANIFRVSEQIMVQKAQDGRTLDLCGAGGGIRSSPDPVIRRNILLYISFTRSLQFGATYSIGPSKGPRFELILLGMC